MKGCLDTILSLIVALVSPNRRNDLFPDEEAYRDRRTDEIDVEVNLTTKEVVAVWYGCRSLPFVVHTISDEETEQHNKDQQIVPGAMQRIRGMLFSKVPNVQ